MPRYFFDIHDGRFIIDDVGHELADLVEVRRELKRLLGELALHPDFAGDTYQVRIDVRDANGRRVLTGSFIMAIEDAA